MVEFSGRLHLESGGPPVPAKLVASEGDISIHVEGTEVASWANTAVSTIDRGKGVEIVADGERIGFETAEVARVLEALSPVVESKKTKAKKAKNEAVPAETHKPAKPSRKDRKAARAGGVERQAPKRQGRSWQLAPVPAAILMATMAVLAAAFFYPMVVASVGIIIGIVCMALGAAAEMETWVALRMPFGINSSVVVLTGGVLTVLGVGATMLAI